MTDNPAALPPRQLLLATDLCPRSDRPLDRAKQLAQAWQAELTVLTVRDGPQTPEEVASWLDGATAAPAFEQAARRELAEEFAGSGVTPTLRVLEGDVTDGILAATGDLADAVVVMGASGDDSFQELILGSTAERLSQELAQPLLVVRQRTRGDYGRIVVANDFSESARTALDTALRLFPGCRITLLHVLEGGLGAPTDSLAATLDETMARNARFLDGYAAASRALIDPAVVHGKVAEGVARYAHENRVQLVVLGVRRRSGMARVFMSSHSEGLLQHLGCDTLLVRAQDERDGADG